MKVPLLDLTQQFEATRDEVMAAVTAVFETQRFVLGDTVAEFERAVAEYVGAQHAIGVTSGTDALLVSLMALEVGPGDEVITTPYSFFATAGSIARVGGRPVFVDINPETYNIAPEQIEAAITDRTKAIIPVHLFGQCAEMGPILALAERHGLAVIEDAAQAIGSLYKGRAAGAMGTTGCFSFYPSKNLPGAGDGGMITTQTDAVARTIAALRNHGMEPKYYHALIGGNFRLDALQAAVLHAKLPHLPEWHAARRRNAAYYDREFAPCAAVATPVVRKESYMTYNQYVVRVPKRDDVIAKLRAAEVGCEVYYPVPLHLQQCFEPLGYVAGMFPEAERAALETLALPIYPELTEAQLAHVCATLKAAVAE
jgi:dTDP-4-amino-4,6-dideoxygalactose transaminase